MSMLDAFFNKGFKGAKCKTLLKRTIPRIKLLRNRREVQLKQMRRDIAKLLETGQEATARIRVEHIIREENVMAAQEIIELFCELIVVRLPIIETQRECPIDLKEAISSICFAAPRCADLSELQQVQMLFAAKYGKEFVAAATELMPDCGVNRQIIELLSVRAPSVEVKMKLLKEIAEEHELDWDPAASETEFLKPHEDLLDGPSHIISDSPSPLPKYKHDESLSSTPVESSHEEPESDTDAGLDFSNLPEVPKVSLRPSPDTVSSPEISPPSTAYPPSDLRFDHEIAKSTSQNHLRPNPDTVSASETVPPSTATLPSDLGLDHETTKSSSSNEVIPHNLEPVVTDPKLSVASVAAKENKQFIPFVSSPPSPSPAFSARQSEKAPSFPEPIPSLQRASSGADVDMQDVLVAAQTAADAAERAAAAARSAASLAQVRITQLVSKMNCRDPEKNQNEFHTDSSSRTDTVKTPIFQEQHSFGRAGDYGGSGMQSPPSHDSPKLEPDAAVHADHQSTHQPQRSTSLEDDSYFSYPNLFSRQDSGVRSSTDHS